MCFRKVDAVTRGKRDGLLDQPDPGNDGCCTLSSARGTLAVAVEERVLAASGLFL